jgi:alkylation response protein AidB-like acyl-CoA dehydrogenase
MGALPVAEFGTAEQQKRWLPGVGSGEVILTAALGDGARATATRVGDGWRLDGECLSVPAAPVATRIIVPARTDDGIVVALADPTARGVTVEPVATTNRERQGHVVLDGLVVGDDEILGDGTTGPAIVEWTRQRAVTGLCALQVGVAEEAVRRAAAYSSSRIQFGRPLSTFQGASLKAADAYIDTEAMRVTMWRAAWLLAEGRDAAAEVAVAKWWASEGGHRVVHVAQHLHGGLGADIDYPIHRYFFWGKQIEDTLGGASAHLAALGRLIAEGTP